MLEQRLKDLQKSKKRIQGFLHYAPHKSFKFQTMVTPTRANPFVKKTLAKNVKKVYIKLAVLKPDGIFMVLLDDGTISHADMTNRKGEWLHEVTVEVSTKEDEELISWFMYELQRGKLK